MLRLLLLLLLLLLLVLLGDKGVWGMGRWRKGRPRREQVCVCVHVGDGVACGWHAGQAVRARADTRDPADGRRRGGVRVFVWPPPPLPLFCCGGGGLFG